MNKNARHTRLRWVFAGSIVAASTLLNSLPAQARITRIEISSTQSPTFEGTSFGDVGQYEKLRGRAFGEVDPNAVPDKKIVDIEFAPRNSRPHQTGTGNGICQQPLNGLTGAVGLRALLVALDDWVTWGRNPPDSEVPRRINGTLVPSLPQAKQGFPNIPGVKYTGLMTTGDLFDFGPQFKSGILTTLPPVVTSPYPVFVPKTDKDGNDIAGVRFPDVEVPLATYTGWALRGAAFAADDLCDGFGQAIPFVKTKAERLASGDPRLSLEERYPNHEIYVKKVQWAARKLQHQGFMLAEDVERAVQAAEASGIGK